jgi:hypothetical protein
MGSWDETCALSNLPIMVGEEVVYLLLTQNPHKDHIGRTGCYYNDFFFVRSTPLYGTYNDYGTVHFHHGQEVIINLILEGFKIDLIENPSEHVCLSELTFENLQKWLNAGLVRIDRNKLDKCYNNTHSPVINIMVRRDVWDAYVNTDFDPDMYTGMPTITARIEMVQKAIENYQEQTILLNKLTDLKEKIFLNQTMRHGWLFAHKALTPTRNPPFSIQDDWTRQTILEWYQKDDFITKDDLLLVLTRMCEIAHVESIMSATRMDWHPTTGSGMQSENEHFELHSQMFEKMANIAKKLHKI